MATQLFNKAVVAQFVSEIFERFSEEHLEDLVSEDVRAHSWTAPGSVDGTAEIKNVLRTWRTSFGNPTVRIYDLLADGDKVVARYVFQAEHAGLFAGVPGTGERITVSGVLIAHLHAGKIAEVWREEDRLAMLRQIGAVPPENALAA